jgi:hypothetical protein
MSVTPRELPIQEQAVVAPQTVAWLDHTGKLTVMDCAICPARDILCPECIVPDLLHVGLTDAGRAALSDG